MMPEQFPEQTVRAAVEQLDAVRREWLRRPGVTAVDVGYRIVDDVLTDELALRVHVERKRDLDEIPVRERFNADPDRPDRWGGFPVDVLVGAYAPTQTDRGGPRQLDDPEVDPRARLTPLMGGISVGNPRVTAGTLGAIVWDTADCAPCILSNWHVLAGSSGGSGGEPHYQGTGTQPHYQSLAGVEPHYQSLAGVEPHYQSASRTQPHYQSARMGEPIYQPGVFDGGTAVDTVAHLSRLRLDRHMDAALARLDGSRAWASAILGLQPIPGMAEPRLGMSVVKSGRSTRVTEGIVDGVSLSTTLDFPHGSQPFEDQIRIVPRHPWPQRGHDYEISDGGDSGALWIEESRGNAIGLHFAGELDPHPSSEHALANPMPRVARELQFSFTPMIAPLPTRPTVPRGSVATCGLPPGEPVSGWPQTAAELERLKAAIDVVLNAMRG